MNADKLIALAKRRAFIPETSSFTPASLLDEANLALRDHWTEAALKADAEFFTETVDLLPDASGHAVFPAEAFASTARVLTWVDANGQESSPLRRVEQGDIGSVGNKGGSGTISVQQPDGTFVLVTSSGNAYGASPTSFALTPSGAQLFNYTRGGYLRCRYSRRPGELVLGTSTTVLQVVGITPGISITTVSPDTVVPSGPTWAGIALDLTSGLSPYRRKALDKTLTSISPNVWSYTGALISVGDYLTMPGTSYVPNAPLEWHDLLMYYTAAQLAGLRKDYDLEARRMGQAEAIFAKLLKATQPRTKQNPKVMSAWAGRLVNTRGQT